MKQVVDANFFLQFHTKFVSSISPAALFKKGFSYPFSGKAPNIIALGKAAQGMMKGFLASRLPLQKGLVVSPETPPEGTDEKRMRVRYLQGNHPLPGEGSFFAGKEVLEFMNSLEPNSSLLVFLSGGTSALVAVPVEGLSHQEKRLMHESLVFSGKSIHEINTVRRHLSLVKGGRLLEIAQQKGIKTIVSVISDVPGDIPHDIGSGPFCPDPTTYAEAVLIAQTIPDFPPAALELLKQGERGQLPETLKPTQVIANLYSFHILANQRAVAQSALSLLRQIGQRVDSNTVLFDGHLQEWCAEMVGRLKSETATTWKIASGEMEIQIPPEAPIGIGGRASHLVLTLGLELKKAGIPFALGVLATDGSDGNSKYGGGFLFAQDLEGNNFADAQRALQQFDAAGFLEACDRTFPGGATGSNFGDLLMIKSGNF
jgi:hydroxypyruvate reductase